MPAPHVITRCTATGLQENWQAATLDELGKSEEFLESVLAANPELLGVRSRRTGIYPPFRVFRQLSLPTPSGRVIYPDIVLLTGSAHVVVVEVKKASNPELKDRAVIAQIIDYAASFARLDEAAALQMFSGGEMQAASWGELIARLFPDDLNADDLSEVLLDRMRRGEINLVIACDRVPAGLAEIVEGVASQHALGFDLDLVEVVPFVGPDWEAGDILFVPSPRLATEIVARTAVTVTYRQGDPQPETHVETTTIDDIEQNVRTARQTNAAARIWTAEEVDRAFEEDGDPVKLKLLAFAKQSSSDGQYVASGPKQAANFGFFVAGRKHDGRAATYRIFGCPIDSGYVDVYINTAAALLDEPELAEFRQLLKSVFGEDINVERPEPSVPVEAMSQRMEEFQQLVLWLQDQARRRDEASAGQADS